MITEQPRKALPKREWIDGLYSCTNDCHTCWCVLCCYPCYMCSMYRRYGECCGTPMAIIFPGLLLRSYHRAKQNIQGTLCSDCAVDYCCTFCAACQLDRDMKYVESTTGILNT
ncbi:Cornifelin [Clonorchis sinensis]|uniref:PLAC8-like protein 1 n=2 Tax=Clonorchis sinensis TaxID=79923 RepID=G7Y7H8_CLOSI|nr:Cornifelin [Clonorchis sinensis]GAA48913.1 PLAC8-like protein 1 [Clonorchis sinensis]